jgi:3-deoxy-D-manno-octulosonate 8-phosphate phosphatase (KDO 8-P phosphatase)
MNDVIKTLAPTIKLLICDVDGVLTDGKITYTSEGHELKSFHAQDGVGLKRLMAAGIDVAIITARKSAIVERRMQELGIQDVYQGAREKLLAFDDVMRKLGFTADQVAYMGDDLPDIPVMEKVALPIAVANATAAVKAIAKYETHILGGEGAVREVCDLLLSCQ